MAFKTSTSGDPIRDKSLHLAIRVVRLCQHLQERKKEYVISKQILRSGTNPGAMVVESKNAESGSDFIHKLAIGQKETAETLYWLQLLYETDYITETEYLSMKSDAEEVIKLIKSSIKTKKTNLGLKIIAILIIVMSLAYLTNDTAHVLQLLVNS